MKSFLLLTCLLTVCSLRSYAQTEEKGFEEQKFSPDSLRVWTTDLMEAVAISHPGMYRYTGKTTFRRLIDSTVNSITDSLTTLAYYRKLKPLFAQIGCLHTSISLSESYEELLDESLQFIPIGIYINDKKQAFVSHNYGEGPPLPPRAEILSINGQPMAEILRVLYRAIPSDGYNETLKTQLLHYQFPHWYRSLISHDNSFVVELKEGGRTQRYTLAGVDAQAFPTMESLARSDEPQLDLRIAEGTGWLTIRSFAKSTIRSNGQNYDAFLRQSFRTLEEEQVKNLVIDLRNNTGGTDSHAVKLASYFFDEPFRYWQTVETTAQIAGQMKGLNLLFYRKPEREDSTYHWRGTRSWYSREFDFYQTQNPARNHRFGGKVYVLTNGFCMSSCSDVVAILSHNQKATVVGQETGGGYQGNTSGLMPETDIFANLVMTIPLQKYTNAVDLDMQFGRGTQPDYTVAPTLEDWITAHDPVPTYVQQLIEQAKQ
ncbi:MAG: S41 family peptidase [Bacteroidota bacterium]